MYEGYEYAQKYGIALESKYPNYEGKSKKCAGHFVPHFFPSSMEEVDNQTVTSLKT